jgi:hypothetical protein
MNDLDFATKERPDKRFKTAQAKLAMLGWKLVRSHPEDDDFYLAIKNGFPTLCFRRIDDAMAQLSDEEPCRPSIAA